MAPRPAVMSAIIADGDLGGLRLRAHRLHSSPTPISEVEMEPGKGALLGPDQGFWDPVRARRWTVPERLPLWLRGTRWPSKLYLPRGLHGRQ